VSLFISLIVLAGLAVGGVWAWGQVQARRAGGRGQAASPVTQAATTVQTRLRAEPTLATTESLEEKLNLPQPRAVTVGFADSLDPETEMVAVLTADAPMLEAKVREAIARHANVGRRSVRAAWNIESPNVLHIGLTLADRSGAVSEAEINHFTHRVDEIADALAANVEVESTEGAIARGRLLDAQCAALDTQVQLHVSAALEASARLNAAISQVGFSAAQGDAPRRLTTTSGAELATLTFKQDAQECVATVVIDVPRAPADAFSRALEAARSMSTSCGGRLIDDNGRELSESAMALVLAKLTDVTRKLAQAGMEPGGERAKRLFS
jgi:hypothetical protein